MRQLIEQVGPFRMSLHRDRFRTLVGSIIAQQISGSAARSIGRRLEQLVHPRKIRPEVLSALTAEQLRGAGLSPQKSKYLLDLAGKVQNKQVRLQRLARMSDEEVIEELIQVNGIGVWTAQMFLMFSLGRLDVFPHEDLGIRSAIRNLYGLEDLPDKETSHRVASRWRPYATMACWYCWRSLERPKAVGNGKTD